MSPSPDRRVIDHLAIGVSDLARSRVFYQAALAPLGFEELGERAHDVAFGAPGDRRDYSPGYYAAFVLDPDGHNLEAVFHDPDVTSWD